MALGQVSRMHQSRRGGFYAKRKHLLNKFSSDYVNNLEDNMVFDSKNWIINSL